MVRNALSNYKKFRRIIDQLVDLAIQPAQLWGRCVRRT